VPINDVVKIMGHEQTPTTLDRYTHPTKDRDRRVLATFAAFSLPPRADQLAKTAQDPSGKGS
jgi:hypothetical protein